MSLQNLEIRLNLELLDQMILSLHKESTQIPHILGIPVS